MVVTAEIIAVLVAYGNVIVVVYFESIILEVGTRIGDVLSIILLSNQGWCQPG